MSTNRNPQRTISMSPNVITPEGVSTMGSAIRFEFSDGHWSCSDASQEQLDRLMERLWRNDSGGVLLSHSGRNDFRPGAQV